MHLSEIKARQLAELRPAAGLGPIRDPSTEVYRRKKATSSGADRDRTGNLRVANAALSRLSYGPGKADQGTPSRSPEYLTTRPPESRTKSRKPAGRRKSPRVANPTSGVHSTLPCCRLKRSNGPDRVRTCDLILIRDAL